jgi:2,4-dienoyl-CoA reductase (NADPH2)
MPDSMPLFVRISCTDWVEGGWDLDQSVELARALKPLGVDLIDASSGALVPYAKIPVAPGFQVPFAAAIRERAEILTGAVGMITEPEQADEIITSAKPIWHCWLGKCCASRTGHYAQQTLWVAIPPWPVPYGYAVRPRRTK